MDGREQRIIRADHAFRAVFVEPGEREVEFSYRPVSFRIGLFGSLSALVLFALFALAGLSATGKGDKIK